MLNYCLNCFSFDSFLERVLNEVILKDVNGLVVISDSSLYDNFLSKSQESNLTVTQHNNISRVDLLLIDSIYELEDVLIQMLQKEPQANQQFYHISSVIGIYGFLSHYLNEGMKIYSFVVNLKVISSEISETITSSFLNMEDFSAKKINFICNLIYNVTIYSGSAILMTDPATMKDVPYSVAPPLEASIPNLSLLDYLDYKNTQDEKATCSPSIFLSTTDRRYVEIAASRKISEVPISLILSKWFTFNFN